MERNAGVLHTCLSCEAMTFISTPPLPHLLFLMDYLTRDWKRFGSGWLDLRRDEREVRRLCWQ